MVFDVYLSALIRWNAQLKRLLLCAVVMMLASSPNHFPFPFILYSKLHRTFEDIIHRSTVFLIQPLFLLYYHVVLLCCKAVLHKMAYLVCIGLWSLHQAANQTLPRPRTEEESHSWIWTLLNWKILSGLVSVFDAL